MNVPTWFLYVGGFSLIILGGLQIQTRPREKGASFYQRFANVGTVWSLCCVGVGVCLVLLALGWLGGPHLPASPRPPRRH